MDMEKIERALEAADELHQWAAEKGFTDPDGLGDLIDEGRYEIRRQTTGGTDFCSFFRSTAVMVAKAQGGGF